MSKSFYRFRPVRNLLDDFNELENQSIYFASPDQLNDPMEGFRDLYWKGDVIAWKNLFKHYLLCLERLCSLLIIGGEEHPISEDDIPAFASEMDFQTPKYKKLFTDIFSSFIAKSKLISLISHICSRTTPIRRDELFFYLKTVHVIAIKAIYEGYEQAGFIPKKEGTRVDQLKPFSKLADGSFFQLIERLLLENNRDEKLVNVLFSVPTHAMAQMDIISRYNEVIDRSHKNKAFVFLDFTEAYIRKIEQLVFPEWYTACFMSECSNSAVWGHYGDNHSGVCLIFKSEQVGGDSRLSLRAGNGWGSSGAIRSFAKHKFYPVEYTKGFGEIDFFRSLGRLPVNILNTVWYSDGTTMSKCAEDMLSNEDEWRKRYWSNFHRDITIKSKDWAYENEYRLILSSPLNSFADKKERALNYSFDSLAGLIFGIKTRMDDKIRIMEIIERKCRETDRTDFKFHQARYSSEKHCIEFFEMNLLEFAKQT